MAKTVVSFGGLEDFVQTSGLLSDVNVTFTNCRFGLTPPNYKDEPVPVFYADLVEDDGTVTPNQMWTCGGGGLDKQQRVLLEPSEDGRYLHTESGFKLSTNSNFYKLVEAFIKLGAPLKAGGADATMLEGLRAHIVRVAQKDRNGKPLIKSNGQPNEIPLPTELLGAEKGKKGIKVASAPGAAATANNGASVDPEVIHKAALETLKKIIDGMKPDSAVSVNALKVKATTTLIATPHKTIRDQVVSQLTNPEWLASNAPEYGAGMDDQDRLYKPE